MTERILNRLIAAGMLCHAFVCAIVFLVVASWCIHADPGLELGPVSMLVFAASSCVILWLARVLSEGAARVRHVAFHVVVSVLAFECSRHFYAHLMHDIALVVFGHHGRFGCIQDGYLATSSTLPWLTFASEPVLVLACLLARRLARWSHDPLAERRPPA